MSVYKPKNSPYFHFDFVWKGRRFHGSTGLKTKRSALSYEEKERAKAVNGGKERPPITLDEASGLYEDKVGAKPSWRNVETRIKVLLAEFAPATLLSEISQRDLLGLVARRRDGRENASVNREIDDWRAIWRHAQKSRFDVGEMPDWGALRLHVPNNDPRELSATEETALFEQIDDLRPDLYDFCLFALKTGWRMSEVMGLRWSDVDMNAAIATTRIKGGDVVKRPLTQEMVVTIANQPRATELPAAGFVFTYVAQRTKPGFTDKLGRVHPVRRRGERYPMTEQVLRRPWAAAKKAAEVENFRFHDLRHTRGTRILRATGNLAAAKEALKHRSIKTTLRYAHASDDDIRRALDASESRTIPEVPAKSVKKGK
ncbi:tyrosine-type recombinase/integrase [Sphingomonas sp. PR090111-T3T-6A]|uniref:tyrosine-type recombinase/integrase n=1 Tax=Sphingomonas sp. PR090111-T3T-6A TaxID=685778 RepID=UPI000364D5A6|nr:site-specific integrase [Sphingomonas sp. PR090111-T3T-6A]